MRPSFPSRLAIPSVCFFSHKTHKSTQREYDLSFITKSPSDGGIAKGRVFCNRNSSDQLSLLRRNSVYSAWQD